MKKLFFLLILSMLVSGCGEFNKGMSAARIKANEEVAQRLCGVYAQTIEVYKERNRNYPISFKQLNDEGYLSPSDPYNRLILNSKPAQGYNYNYSYIDENHFIFEAGPAQKGVTGNKAFRVDQAGTVYAFDSP